MTDNLTPHEAAKAVALAARYDEPLQQRTEGLTMMAWGLSLGGMYASYGIAALRDAPQWALATLWMPWIAAAIAFTFALWRSAALSAREPTPVRAWPMLARAGLLTLAFLAVFAVARPDGPLLPLAIVGALWSLMVVVDLFRGSATGKRLWLAAGVACLAAAGALALAQAPMAARGAAAMLVPSAVPFALGLYQTMRG